MPHHHHKNHSSGQRIGIAFFLNLAFTVLEIIGGYLTNSVAIMADALHDFGDSAALGLGWYLDHLAKKPSDERFTFGYRRFSLLGAVLTGLILLIGSLFVLTESIPRLLEPEAVHPAGMFGLAVLGVLVNGIAVIKLRAGQTLNERMVSLHLLEDVLGWVAVLVVSVVMYFFELPILDPILSVLITLYILRGVITNLKQAIVLFLQGVPPEVQVDRMKKEMESILGVKEVHHTHVWSQDGENHVMSTHIVSERNLSDDQINSLRHEIKSVANKRGISHATVEIEIGDGNCTDSIGDRE